MRTKKLKTLVLAQEEGLGVFQSAAIIEETIDGKVERRLVITDHCGKADRPDSVRYHEIELTMISAGILKLFLDRHLKQEWEFEEYPPEDGE